MILQDLPTIDDAVALPRARPSRLLGRALSLSVLVHVAAIGMVLAWHAQWSELGLFPPKISLHSRRVSVELHASVAAAPQADSHEETRMPAPLFPLARALPETKLDRPTEKIVREPLPKNTKPAQLQEELVVTSNLIPPPHPIPRIEPKRFPEPSATNEPPPRRARRVAAHVAPAESADSVASRAVEGSDFDEPPQPHTYNVKPPYPAEAQARGLQGLVLLRLTINATGRVVEATVLQSSGVPSLDDSAQRTALQWNFIPAKRRGVQVTAVMTKLVRFTHPGAG